MSDKAVKGWKAVIATCGTELIHVNGKIDEGDLPLTTHQVYKKRAKQLRTQISFARIAVSMRLQFIQAQKGANRREMGTQYSDPESAADSSSSDSDDEPLVNRQSAIQKKRRSSRLANKAKRSQ